ncbi:PAS domain S-box-containing protein [Pedobacter cryoconitis]|uniref:PAS domain-containing sensor histidine kinase n=1 Tax=Pedobacter cryoconitis TaxID=188932 RepID=UPI001616E5DE|nr:ATP-binding protein [Pedobacter cryoconitis]MBB6271247.1 PAS domain S-box-containing protein [Pedobacter cryoconitis]
MSLQERQQASYPLYLEGGGEMGMLTRSFNWSETVLGTPDKWSPNLLTILSIILHSKFPMFLWWGPDLIQFYNDAYKPSLGKDGKHPKALGQKGAECWPEIWPVIKPLIDQVMNGGEATWQEDQLIPIYRNNNLEDVYWTFCYSRVIDVNGEIGGILVTCTETTNKIKRTQEIEQTLIKLAESESRSNKLITQAPVAVGVLKTKDLIIETANSKILQFWGKSANIIGLPLALALPELEGQPFLQILDDVYTTGTPYSSYEIPARIEYNGIFKICYFDFLYQPILNQSGETESILVVATDLTEQVEARKIIEENFLQFRQLADSIAQMVWVTDESGTHEYLNKRWYDFTGSNFDHTKNEGWDDLVHPDDVARAAEKWIHSLNTGDPFEIEYRLKKHTGEYVWVLGRAAPFYNAEGKIAKWFGTCTDIHDQKLLQEQKDDFISIASHELKTPITTLKVSLQLMQRMIDNQSPQMMSNLIERANKSMDKVGVLIEDLLNTSKYNHGQLHLKKTVFEMADVIDECCSHIDYEGKHTIKITGDTNLKVYADAGRISQIVTNFINNAIKYAPKSKEIIVRVYKENDQVKLTVQDKGPGIASEKIPHIFDRYYRVDSSGSQYSGLGLGLYICSEIIKKHGGTIGVDSKPGEGSTFWFTLPFFGTTAAVSP